MTRVLSRVLPWITVGRCRPLLWIKLIAWTIVLSLFFQLFLTVKQLTPTPQVTKELKSNKEQRDVAPKEQEDVAPKEQENFAPMEQEEDVAPKEQEEIIIKNENGMKYVGFIGEDPEDPFAVRTPPKDVVIPDAMHDAANGVIQEAPLEVIDLPVDKVKHGLKYVGFLGEGEIESQEKVAASNKKSKKSKGKGSVHKKIPKKKSKLVVRNVKDSKLHDKDVKNSIIDDKNVNDSKLDDKNVKESKLDDNNVKDSRLVDQNVKDLKLDDRIVEDSELHDNAVVDWGDYPDVEVFEDNDIFPHRYLINQPYACDERVKIINIVPVAADRLENRLLIRDLWGDTEYLKTTGMKTLFLVGTTNSSKTQADLNIENELLHDIIQMEFNDSYENLSLKTLSILHWVSHFCPEAEWLLKSDDDVFVNPFAINTYLEQMEETADFICLVHGSAKVCHEVEEHCPDKWVVPMDVYPNGTYPTYCKGGGYFINSAMVPPLYDGADKVSPLFIEDAYFTGIVAEAMEPRYQSLGKSEFPSNPVLIRKSQKAKALMLLNYERRKGDSYRLWDKVLRLNNQPHPKKPRNYKAFGNLGKGRRGRKIIRKKKSGAPYHFMCPRTILIAFIIAFLLK